MAYKVGMFNLPGKKPKDGRIFHIYSISASDVKVHHWMVRAKDEYDAREIFEATEDDLDTEFIVLYKPIKRIEEHARIISEEDIGE